MMPFLFVAWWALTTYLGFQNLLQMSALYTRSAAGLEGLRALLYLLATFALVRPVALSHSDGRLPRTFWVAALLCNPWMPAIGKLLAPLFIFFYAHRSKREVENGWILWPRRVSSLGESLRLGQALKAGLLFVVLDWGCNLLGLAPPEVSLALRCGVALASLTAFVLAHRLAYVHRSDVNLSFPAEFLAFGYFVAHTTSLGLMVSYLFLLTLDEHGRPRLQLRERLLELLDGEDGEALGQFCESHNPRILAEVSGWLKNLREDELAPWDRLAGHYRAALQDDRVEKAVEAHRQALRASFQNGLRDQETRSVLVEGASSDFNLAQLLDEVELSQRSASLQRVDLAIDELEKRGQSSGELVVLYGLRSGLKCED